MPETLSSTIISSAASSKPLPVSPIPFTSFSQSHSIANAGNAIPESVIDSVEKEKYQGINTKSSSPTTTTKQSSGTTVDPTASSSSTTNHRHHHHWTNDRPFFWLDRLDEESNSHVMDRWKQRQDRKVPSFIKTAPTLQRPFSLLSWNILSQKLYAGSSLPKRSGRSSDTNENGDSDVPKSKESSLSSTAKTAKLFTWDQRLEWIVNTIVHTNSDVVCLQEVEYDTFQTDLLPALQQHGYDGVVQGGHGVKDIQRRKGKAERAHVVATFWKRNRFQPVAIIKDDSKKKKDKATEHHDQLGFAHMARGRTMTSALQDVGRIGDKEENTNGDEHRQQIPSSTAATPTLAVINCHLEGHPRQYAARIRQLQHAMGDLIKRKTCGPSMNGLAIAGDFNCELQSSACSTYLRIGRVGRKGGLGGVHGTSALVVPESVLESEEASEILHPIIEWGNALPNEDMENVEPHPFRRNSLVSAYPPQLGHSDPRLHFTYCANPHRPVAGLDQIWYSGFSMTRVALRKMFESTQKRKHVLNTGLPQNMYPSDHLPIGAVFDWNACDDDGGECDVTTANKKCSEAGVRELIITEDRVPPTPKVKSPIMAYAELDMLLVTCPFDSDDQRTEFDAILNDVPDLPPDNKKPSQEQLKKLRDIRERKRLVLMNATESVRPILQRILKLSKEVAGY
mmetsp:Transcript_6888/g.10451  ORF Transcript_6888/g.10451 Transcript_6888/m.10451 type:complete len:679 (-) Transcript_6888:128-2164(-)